MRKALDLMKHAALRPDRVAVIVGERSYTYLDFASSVSACSAFFNDTGIREGKARILKWEQTYEFICAYYALILSQLIPIVVDPANELHMKEAEKICSITIDPSDLKELIDSKIPEVNISSIETSDTELILFTSGTTGCPKAVHLDYCTTEFTAENLVREMQMDFSYTWLEVVALPLCHSFGLGRMRAIFKVAGTLILCQNFLKASDLIIEHLAQGFAMVPSGLQLMQKRNPKKFLKLDHYLLALEIGSAPMSLKSKTELMKDLPSVRIYQHYGSTEASRTTLLDFRKDVLKLGSVGKPISGIDVALTDVNEDQSGIIAIAGNNVACPSRLVSTGDIGTFDDEGYLYIWGRKDDMLIIGGHSFLAQDLEEVLSEIGESIALRVETGGQEMLIVYMPESTYLPTFAVREFLVEKNVAPYMIPRIVIPITEIPKTANGKVMRNVLLEMFLATCPENCK